MTEGVEREYLNTPVEAGEQLTDDCMNDITRWLEFRVRAQLVDGFVTSDPNEINIQSCFDVITRELWTLEVQSQQELIHLDMNIAKALAKKIQEANAWNDYTQNDVDILRLRHEACSMKVVVLQKLQAHQESLWTYVEQMIAAVREQASREAITVLQDKVIAAEREQLLLSQRLASLQEEVSSLHHETETRDAQLWEAEIGSLEEDMPAAV